MHNVPNYFTLLLLRVINVRRLARERVYPVSSVRDLLPRDYESPRDLPTSFSLSPSPFLDLSSRRAFLGSFFASFGYQLYQFYTELDRALRFCRFLFSRQFFFSFATFSQRENEGPRINPRLIVTYHELQIATPSIHFICTARLSIFATLLTLCRRKTHTYTHLSIFYSLAVTPLFPCLIFIVSVFLSLREKINIICS